jgi:hypothetical protein
MDLWPEACPGDDPISAVDAADLSLGCYCDSGGYRFREV